MKVLVKKFRQVEKQKQLPQMGYPKTANIKGELYEFDAYANLIEITFNDHTRQVLDYDQYGNLIRQVTEEDEIWLYMYDQFGNCTTVIEPYFKIQKNEFDKYGNLIAKYYVE